MTQVAPTRFRFSDDDQYLMMNKEEEGDDEMISC